MPANSRPMNKGAKVETIPVKDSEGIMASEAGSPMLERVTVVVVVDTAPILAAEEDGGTLV